MSTAPRLPIPQLRIRLNDPGLFGNDAADLESDTLFHSYAIERDELNDLKNADHSIQIIRAFKGEGKSALLKLLTRYLNTPPSDELVISAIGSDHSPVLDHLDADMWGREWKKRILRLIASEIGARIGVAFEDDAISLVEEAEINGYKKRTLVSAVVDRLRSATVPLERSRLPIGDYEKIVKRYINERPLVWLIIDDIDQNFQNTERWRVKLASFFTACRQISSSIPELRIRASIRPNVWAIIKREYESLSHLEQYMQDLTWTRLHYRELLANRVAAYLHRTQQWGAVRHTLPHDKGAAQLALIQYVFDGPMAWGGADRTAAPHTVLWTLSAHRPRWLVELCKEAGKSAAIRSSNLITLEDIRCNLEPFGRKRIEDTEAEFRSQCPQISELLGGFSRQSDIYHTDELLKTIRNRVLGAINPSIVGVVGKTTDLDVAHFLFQIGFLAGRRDHGINRGYDHISYKDNPTLLRSRTNLDDGLRWEVNPVFRHILNLRSASGKDQRRIN